MPKRRNYSPEFKREAVELTRMEGVTISQIARDLGIRANMLGRWRRELSADAEKAFQGQGKARDEGMASLRRELARVKKERDFLKEAAAFFAKASK
jgi:transposase